MADKKLITLVSRLRERTLQGKINWKETSNNGEFTVSFPKYSVILSLKPTKLPELQSGGDDDVVLTIINDEGETIEEVRDIDFSKEDFSNEYPYTVMLEIYSNARRSAMGVDEAINSILSGLEDK